MLRRLSLDRWQDKVEDMIEATVREGDPGGRADRLADTTGADVP
jgi:hypothetical protein